MLLEMALFHSFQLSHPLSAAALINSLDGFELMFVLQQNHVIKCEKKKKKHSHTMGDSRTNLPNSFPSSHQKSLFVHKYSLWNLYHTDFC